MKRMVLATGAMAVAIAGAWAMGVAVGAQTPAPAAPPQPLGQEAQIYVNTAKLLAANDIRVWKTACPGQPPLPKQVTRGERALVAPPTKIFDQLYFLGSDFVASYALVTSGGIILFDTMNNNDDVQKVIIGGMKTLGLDPSKIKHMILSHGHGDHYGGAKALQELYNPHILAGPGDWDMMATQQLRPATDTLPEFGAPPRRDMDVADGQKLVLGDTTVTLYRTPGHTVDTVSAIFRVTDRGVPHMVTWVGGTLPGNDALKMAQSYERLLKLSEEANVDTYISPHPYADSAWSEIDRDVSKIDKLKARKAGDPHPFVAGRDKMIRYLETHIQCTYARWAYGRQQADK